MSKNNEGFPWGCVGTVLAAVIVGTATLIVALPSFAPLIHSRAVVQNQLFMPVRVYVNNKYQGVLNAQSSDSFILDAVPAFVNIELIRDTKDSGGYWGETVEAEFARVENGDQLLITNMVGKDQYFYPVLYNNRDEDCSIYINQGTSNEQFLGTLKAHKQGVSMGYYPLLMETNLSLNCNSGNYWWGINSELGGDPLYLIVEPQSGRTLLTLNP